MNFSFSKEEEAFRQEVLDFIEKEAPPEMRGVGITQEDRLDNDEERAFVMSIRRKLGAKGWLALTWPKEYGGLGKSHIEQLILSEEMTYHGVPGLDAGAVIRLGPIIMVYGSNYQKKKFLPPMASGEAHWAQGFSEPEAGSDLASLRTRAVESGDYFIVNGQKVWQTHGDWGEWCYLLARTDPNVPKHQGISFFVVDLKSPGVTVRPLRTMVHRSHFSEIFFDNVTVPKENLVGEKNQGWKLANATLNAERSGINLIAQCRRFLDEIVRYVKETDHVKEPSCQNHLNRHKLAEMAIELAVARLFSYRVACMQYRGLNIRHEASISKLYGSEVMQRLSVAAVEILGLYGQLEKGSEWAPLQGKAEQWYLSTRARTLAGGTSEIQRNIIALRGLGLPRK